MVSGRRFESDRSYLSDRDRYGAVYIRAVSSSNWDLTMTDDYIEVLSPCPDGFTDWHRMLTMQTHYTCTTESWLDWRACWFRNRTRPPRTKKLRGWRKKIDAQLDRQDAKDRSEGRIPMREQLAKAMSESWPLLDGIRDNSAR